MTAKAFTRRIAKGFALRGGEEDEFSTCWKLVKHLARGGLPDDVLDHHKAVAAAMVEATGGFLRAAVDGVAVDALGHRHVRTLPTAGRYVVFSDHHITHRDHRQEFFASSGNLEIYVEALEQYLSAGYTLVENGDVEELVIWDPADPDFVHAMDRRKQWNTLGSDAWHHELPRFLLEQRLAIRYRLLEKILADPDLHDYREQVRAFDDADRLVRIAGNHDYNLQGEAFFDLLKGAFPRLSRVDDYLLLRDDNGRVDYAILHGHQVDMTTNPASAPRFGETFSECLAIWYQGGDRTWRWAADGPEDWATRRKRFLNALTEDHHGDEEPRPGPAPTGPEDLPPGHDHLGDRADELLHLLLRSRAPLSAFPAAPDLDDEDDEPAGESSAMKRFFEKQVFGHAVAWEYFENDPDVLACIFEEVLRGVRVDLDQDGVIDVDEDGDAARHRRFFKYRHTNEQSLCRQLVQRFQPHERPTVVLGHTHEPRLHSRIPGAFVTRLRDEGEHAVADELEAMGSFGSYINSASAGRFERLVWAVEIDHGVARMVSWARTHAGVERRVWDIDANSGDLMAAAVASDVP